MEEKLEVNDLSVNFEYVLAKKELERYFDKITDGIIIRSRVQWYEQGEKNTKYFLGLEKSVKQKSSIRKIIGEDGIEIEDPKLIQSEIKTFYAHRALRKISVTQFEVEQYLSSINTPSCSSEQVETCNKEISLTEIFNALKSMSLNKTPGNDGLPVEFYLKFFDDIGPLLLDCIRKIYQTKIMAISQRQACVTLIQKPGKDHRYLKSWRPISLINVDAKVISKILALRLQSILPDIISQNQFAFVKGRNIDEAIRVISDILEYTSKESIPGIIFGADYERAFDSLDFYFIFSVMKVFGFPEYFINWVEILHNQLESCVMNNGFSTGYFPVKRGTRQGDPLAAYIFILTIEVLSLFADDSTFFLKDIESFYNLNDTLLEFSISLKVNPQKSEIAWIGSSKLKQDNILNYKSVNLTQGSKKILGIHFSYNKALSLKNNLDNVYSKFVSCVNLWKTSQLSLYGKSVILKTLALPKIMYVCDAMIPNIEFIKAIHTEIRKFFWKGGIPKIKENVLICDIKDGGIKMPNISLMIKAQRISWIKRFIDKENSLWKKIPKFYFKKAGILVVGNNLSKECILKVIPDFYRTCLQDWSEMFNELPCDSLSVLAQPLWNNTYIRVNNIPYFYRQLFEENVNYIRDIIERKLNCTYKELYTKHCEG